MLHLPPLCELNFLQILHLLSAPTMCTHKSAKENPHPEICSHAVKFIKNKKIWGVVKSLSLQPYANPRSN
ncbi:hypothetical protein CIPAW_02G105600 [Carya illinoinensis]|uniref:Secreted protein n=1 Tax=Carya illinoinensis TaxID=32201 RepID=A0A8T1REY8_CARIL|nr:hypothetical protein CIPAW_02G105600 [Carya illinoinensis]